MPDRHPTTGRWLAHDCEIDCQTACAGLCGPVVADDPWTLLFASTGPTTYRTSEGEGEPA